MGGGGRGHAGRRRSRRAGLGPRAGQPRGRGRLRRPTSSSRSSYRRPRTSRCSCSATATATSSTCSSATARCSAATRRSSRSRPRLEPRPGAARPICDAALAHRPGRRLRQRRHRRVPRRRRHGRRSTSSRSTRASRSSTPSPRRSPASTWCESQILDRPGAPLWPTRSACPAGRDQRQRLRHPVPRHHRRPDQQLHARLRPDRRTTARPAASASGSTAARRSPAPIDHAVLRLAAGEGHAPGAARSIDALAPHGARPAGVPHPRREDEHPVPAERASTHPDFLARQRHHALHRRDAGAVPVRRAHATAPPSCSPTSATSSSTAIPTVNGQPELADRAEPPPLRRGDRSAAAAARATAPRAGPREVRRSGCASRSRCCSPTPPCATPTSRCWPRACARSDMLRVGRTPALATARPVLAGDVGRGDVRHRHAVPQGGPLAAPAPSCASASRTSSSRCCCRAATPSATPTTPTTSCERFVARGRRAPASTSSASSTPSTGSPNMRVAIEAVPSTPAASARRPSATPATSSTRSATKYNLNYYVDLAKELGEDRRAHPRASRTWPACCRPRGRGDAGRPRCAARSACPSTSTPTTPPAASSPPTWPPSGGRRHRRCAMGPFSGMTSQPSLGAPITATDGTDTPRCPSTPGRPRAVLGGGAAVYQPFEAGLAAHRHRLPPRDPRRPALQPPPAGDASAWATGSRTSSSLYAACNELLGRRSRSPPAPRWSATSPCTSSARGVTPEQLAANPGPRPARHRRRVPPGRAGTPVGGFPGRSAPPPWRAAGRGPEGELSRRRSRRLHGDDATTVLDRLCSRPAPLLREHRDR